MRVLLRSEGFAGEEVSTNARGQLLYPWPNRMGEGEWSFSGREARPRIDDVAHATAIHGLVRWLPFRIDASCSPGDHLESNA